MVRGLDLFRDYFKDYTDKYILRRSPGTLAGKYHQRLLARSGR